MHPGALWLAAGAAVPLIIHLFSRHRPRVIPFPAVRFILSGRRKSMRRTRLKHLLLLLLRMALIVLMALLIARPGAGRARAARGGAAGTPAAVFIMDDSLSMNYRSGGSSAFDMARNRALETFSSMPAGTAAALLTTSNPRGRLVRDLSRLKARLSGMRAGNGSSSCWAALEAAAELLRQKGASRRDVFVFTDMTRSAWLGYERRSVDVGQQVDVHIVDCGPDEAANGAVVELLQEGEPAIRGAVLRIRARVAASGARMSRQVRFEMDGTAVDSVEVELQPGTATELSFSSPLSSPGHHWGRVSLLNPDGLPQDDARGFAVQVAPDVSVLCVEDEPESSPDSPSYFFRLALNPWQQPGRGAFRIRRASPAELRELALGPYDVIALVGAGGMTEEAWQRLDGYVSGGGGLLVFLGPLTGASYRGAAARAALPGRVGQVASAPAGSPFGLRIVRSGHPLVRALQASGASLATAHFLRCRRLAPAPDAAELLSFGPGLPALVVGEVGGRVAVFASTADRRWNDLPASPAFVPFCQELALYLARRTGGSLKSFAVGAHVPITFETSRWPTAVYVTAPGASSRERLLPGTTPGRITYWKTDEPGYYRVDFERRDRKWQGGFAVNTAPVESHLEKVPFERLKECIRAGRVELVGRHAPPAAEAGAANGPAELTPYVAILALVLLLLECFLANRFYRPAPARAVPAD